MIDYQFLGAVLVSLSMLTYLVTLFTVNYDRYTSSKAWAAAGIIGQWLAVALILGGYACGILHWCVPLIYILGAAVLSHMIFQHRREIIPLREDFRKAVQALLHQYGECELTDEAIADYERITHQPFKKDDPQ